MNDLDLGTALRDRVADEHPDLDRLLASSMRAGTRIRRRRRAAVSLAALAVAGIAGGGMAVATGGGQQTAHKPGFASDPTASSSLPSALRDGDSWRMPSGHLVRVTVAAEDGLTHVLVVDGSAKEVADLRSAYPSAVVGARVLLDSRTGRQGSADAASAPVTVAAADWTCEWFLADDKASCSAPGGRTVGIVIRPASEHDQWASDPDKGATPDVFTSDVHGQVFVTVQGGTPADVRAVGKSLRWTS
jgi:hypothetical protein